MIWEDHPEYQKQQARWIGGLLLLLLVVCVVSFIASRDWDSLKQVLLLTGAFILVLGLFSGSAWLVVRIFTKKHHADDAKMGRTRDA